MVHEFYWEYDNVLFNMSTYKSALKLDEKPANISPDKFPTKLADKIF